MARTLGDFVPAGVRVPLAQFGEQTATLYIEAVNGQPRPETIRITVRTPAGDVLAHDEVSVQAFDPLVGLDADVQIEGYGIIRGSSVGTAGNDIIFVPPGSSEVHGYDGDDIIVAGPGDMTIHAGYGSDVVFASLVGHKVIFLEDLDETIPPARPESARGGVGGERSESLDDAPITTVSVRRAYALLFGENDPWLDYFDRAGGEVRAVAYTLVPAGEVGMWCERDAPGEEGKKVTITFGLHPPPASPFEVAAAVRERILDLAGRGSDDPCGLRRQFEGVVGDAIAVGLARRQVHEDPDHPLQTYAELRQAAFDDAVACTAAISNIYISSIGLVSEGADFVLTINDLFEGRYTSAVALLPFISAPMVNNTYRCILRGVDSAPLIRKVGEVCEHFPGLGWIYQRRMNIRFGTPNADGFATVVLGKGQRTLPPNTDVHAAACETLAFQWANQGGFEYVVMNRTTHTCTGIPGLGDAADLRVDVFGVMRGADGQPRFVLREYRSGTQTQQELRAKLDHIKDVLASKGFPEDNIDIDVLELSQ